MYLELKDAAFNCPVCAHAVRTVVVTGVSTVFTAAAQAMHKGYGHTAVLSGHRWSIRCTEERVLRPLAVVVAPDKVLRSTEAAGSVGEGPRSKKV